MNRLVFSVVALQNAQGASLAIQLKEPATFGRAAVELGVTPSAPEFLALHGVPTPGAVRQAGRLLFDALVRENADLRRQMDAALLVQPPQRFPVFVELTTSGAESFPWEALCSEAGDFLGLDERWAVGRIVETISPVPGTWRFAPPLRVAAILSCLGVPATDEWEALRAACEASDLPLHLLVLASEDTVVDQITALGLDWVTVEFVPDTVQEMSVRLQRFNAHVLHFFCHGLSTETSPHLQIAVRSDWLTMQSSSLMVEARDIRTFNPPVEGLPWLVVLNSCETAAVAGQQSARSVALDLIYEGGVPAVVGMREPVRSDDATLFTRAFYDQVLPEFGRPLSTAGAPPAEGVPGGGEGTGGDEGVPVDWARLVVSARAQIAEQYEPLTSQRGTQKEWTLPVVYTRPSQFRVQVGTTPASGVTPPAPEATGESTRSLLLSIEALTGLKAQVASAGDPAMLAKIDAELAALRALVAAP